MKYDFTKGGISMMYSETLEMIMSALMGENKDFHIDELDIKIKIGDKEITAPLYADSFEALFHFLSETHKECYNIGKEQTA